MDENQCSQDIPCEHDLFIREKYRQIAVGVCRSPMEQNEADPVDRHRFTVLLHYLCREAIGRWHSATAGCKRCFLLLLLIDMSDDGEPVRKTRQSIHVIAVAVSNDNVRDGLCCQLRDFRNELLARVARSFRVYDDHTMLSNDYPGISSTTRNPVDRSLPQRMNGHGLSWLRLKRQLCQGDSTQTYDRRYKEAQLSSITRTPHLSSTQCEGNLICRIAGFIHATSLSTGRKACRIFAQAAYVF